MTNHNEPANKKAQRNELIRSIRTEMGLSIEKLGEMFNITRQRVQQILGKTGFQASKLGSRAEREQMERDALKLRQDGLSAEEIAKLLGVGRPMIYTILHKHNIPVRVEETNRMRSKSGRRRCYRCKEIKPLEEFGHNRAIKDGISNVCKTCNTENTKKYYRAKK